MTEKLSFESWGIVEVMGHLRLAGRITEQVIAGKGFIRVDVPATSRQPEFTRYFSTEAIYSLSPTTEEIARAVTEELVVSPAPVKPYELPEPSPPAPARIGQATFGDGSLVDDGWDDPFNLHRIIRF